MTVIVEPQEEEDVTTTAAAATVATTGEESLTRRQRMEKALRIAEELLSTEEQYVSVLHLIDQVRNKHNT